jgi:hypothetical protein
MNNSDQWKIQKSSGALLMQVWNLISLGGFVAVIDWLSLSQNVTGVSVFLIPSPICLRDGTVALILGIPS